MIIFKHDGWIEKHRDKDVRGIGQIEMRYSQAENSRADTRGSDPAYTINKPEKEKGDVV